jgi:hypothetical protein
MSPPPFEPIPKNSTLEKFIPLLSRLQAKYIKMFIEPNISIIGEAGFTEPEWNF